MAHKMNPAVGADIRSFVQRFHELTAQRDSMDSLFKDLVIYCNDIENELRHESQRLLNAQIDLQNAAAQKLDLERRVRLYEAEEDDAKVKVNKEMEKLKNHNPYVMVLIDGDGLMFRDTWVKQGLEGGKKVAYALRAAVAEKFGEEVEDLEIVAKVVANLSGLSKAMQRDGCVDSPSILKDFTLGFTQAKATFDYIDVGYGKERADSKIKETTRWHLRNHNCKHIMLGISHDAGYAPFLDETLQNEATRQRISIIEGVTTVPDLVATNIKIEKLADGLFRDDKLSGKFPTMAQMASSQTPSRTASPAVSAGSSQVRTPNMSYAGIVSSASPPPQITLPFTLPRKQQTQSGTASWREKSQGRVTSEPQYQLIPSSIPENWNPGRRGFDEPIRVNVQKDICPFAHDYKINEDEIKAVAVLARQNPCSSGQYCEAEDCIYGHHCPSIRDGTCVHPYCKFSEEAHPPGTKYKSAYIHAN